MLAVNKIDLVGFDAERLRGDRRRLPRVRRELGLRPTITAIPMSALRRRQRHRPRARGCPGIAGRRCSSISRRSTSTSDVTRRPFRMPVQWVNRPNQDFRGFAGTVASGTVEPRRRGQRRAVRPASARSTRIVTFDGDRDRGRGRAVGHADAGRRDRRQPRRRAGASERARRSCPTSSRRTSSG